MDFNDTPDQAKFREKCRTWLENNAPYKDGSAKMESFANKDILKEAKAWPVSYTHLTLPTTMLV